MNLSVEQATARVPVTILRVQGDMDGSNYRDVIAQTEALYKAGARHLLIDLTQVPFMSSAGMVALHATALLFRGAPIPDDSDGWRAIRALGEAGQAGAQEHVRLLGPQPRVLRVLEQIGMHQLFPIFGDEPAALASF